MKMSLKRKGYMSENWVENKKSKVEDDEASYSAPREVNIVEYAESHILEIQEMTRILKKEPCGQTVAQRIPRHMRRRAMGHDVKRLPRSVRAMDKNKKSEKANKRPSRKHRRRPRNLLAEYTRRQRKHIWMETHIWHAKRFHMIDKWGYKIPWRPTAKSSRACYRATTRHCLIQDLSYMCCIEIKGEQRYMLEELSHLTNSQTGQTFAAVSCLSGTREGQTVLYHYDSYPWNAIGPVTFMWNPNQPIKTTNENEAANESKASIQQHPSKPMKSENDTEAANQRQLWIWCHPACWKEVWDELLKCFSLEEKPIVNESQIDNNKNQSKPDNIEEGKAEHEKTKQSVDNDKTKPSVNNEKTKQCATGDGTEQAVVKVVNNDQPVSAIRDKFKTDVIAFDKDNKVCMVSLSGSVQRFRLTGPESVAVLVDILQEANVTTSDKPTADVTSHTSKWWSEFYKDETAQKSHDKQRELIAEVGKCLSPAELPVHCIFAATVRDPRITRPVKRTKVESDDSNISSDMGSFREKLNKDTCLSPLWCDVIREQVTSSKPSDLQIHQLKAQQLVPGVPLDETDTEAKIPVIIVQRPGVTSLHGNQGRDPRQGHGSSLDLLLPKGWAMPFWLALVFRGARCGGLKESEDVAFESKSLLFPNSFPDTEAGHSLETDKEKELVDKYNRIPPAKRVNYTKMNVASPFKCPWELLVDGTNKSKPEMNEDIENGTEMNEVGETGKELETPESKKVVEIAETGKVLEATETGNVFETAETGKVLETAETGKVLETDESRKVPKSGQFFVIRVAKVLRQLDKLCKPQIVSKSMQNKGSVLDVIDILTKEFDRGILPVKVDMIHRGCPGNFSMICLPKAEDMNKLVKDKIYGGPLEPACSDPVLFEKTRLKREMKEKGIKKKVKIDRTLKVIGDKEAVDVNSCTRMVIGYLNVGGYTLGSGNASGLGFVTSTGFKEVLKGASKKGVIVLVRSTTSLQYRFAYLSIVV